MQSSAMVAFRTVIMISCLVAVPLAALTGTAVTKAVKTALGDRGAPSRAEDGGNDEGLFSPAHLIASGESQAMPIAVAPANETAEVAQAGPELPRARITGVRAVSDAQEIADGGPTQTAIETAPLWNPPPRTASTPRNRDMTAHFVPSRAPASLPPDRPARGGRPKGLHKTVYSQPDEDSSPEETPAARIGGADKLVPIGPSVADDRFAVSERRLRELGAIYYRLETWGDDGRFYRCSCSIAAAPQSRATRHFEAIDAAPSQAIESVISQVQAWRDKSVAR